MLHLYISSYFYFIFFLPFSLSKYISSLYSLYLSLSYIILYFLPLSYKFILFLFFIFLFSSYNSYLLSFYSYLPSHFSYFFYPIYTIYYLYSYIIFLSMNSFISILQLCLFKSETHMYYIHIYRYYWAITKQLDITKLTYV